ncbi:hypothetical protein [Paulownia witches'-broom phytoplasma]|uniref:hypothetical protein n=1 Tax=Paulownia witches'-broom phytoplasma TaxID=39647 RepID=UPI001CEC8EDE|nr:hypothetical protein [Paulownia witches'-broom phytoplasma]GLH60508.1 hypothetical protein PAWBP_2460 [Paulownia witches'-broom phytoplasma]
MNIQQTIINIVESKIFISFTSFIFGIFIYWLYFYIKEWKSKYDFSDELRDVVNHYLKKGKIRIGEIWCLS